MFTRLHTSSVVFVWVKIGAVRCAWDCFEQALGISSLEDYSRICSLLLAKTVLPSLSLLLARIDVLLELKMTENCKKTIFNGGRKIKENYVAVCTLHSEEIKVYKGFTVTFFAVP